MFVFPNIALALGMSEKLVGLTIVSIGTSLPELVTSLMAAKKGEVVIVPPGWGHQTVNANIHAPMVFGAWCVKDYGFDLAKYY